MDKHPNLRRTRGRLVPDLVVFSVKDSHNQGTTNVNQKLLNPYSMKRKKKGTVEKKVEAPDYTQVARGICSIPGISSCEAI